MNLVPIPPDLEALCAILAGDEPPIPIEWEEVLTTARRHRASPLLCWQLDKRRKAESTWASRVSLPAEAWDELRQDYRAAVLRWMRVTHQSREVLAALSQAGLHPMPIKGATLAQHCPRPELRVYGDLDVLLPQGELARAVHAGVQNRIGQTCLQPIYAFPGRYQYPTIVDLYFPAPAGFPRHIRSKIFNGISQGTGAAPYGDIPVQLIWYFGSRSWCRSRCWLWCRSRCWFRCRCRFWCRCWSRCWSRSRCRRGSCGNEWPG